MQNRNSSFLIRFLAPEYLFLLGVIQALFPYIIWAIRGVNENYSQDFFGTPVLLWTIGFLSFCVGARVASSRRPNISLDFKLNPRRMNCILYLTLLAWFLIFLLVINSYGGIPLAQFLSGSNSIDNINASQATAIPGLFGVWLVLNTFLALSVSFAIIGRFFCKRTLSLVLLTSIFAVIFGSIISGKRQSLLIAATLIFPSITIGMNFFLAGSKLRSFNRRIFRFSVIALVAVIVIFGFIGQIRTAGNIESGSIAQIFSYLEYPLINMEWQLQEFSFAGGADNIIPLLAGLIPYKLISGSDYGLDNTYAIYSFFYPEPGIGAGYFGPAHLAFGIVGVIVFGALSGLISRKIFNLSKIDPRWSASYSCFVWPLISAHSYSHLTSVLFFWLPFVLSIMISHFVFFKIKRLPQKSLCNRLFIADDEKNSV